MALRRGALGTAAIAQVVIAANPGRFRAVAGRDPTRTAAFAASTGLQRTFDGYAAMLVTDEVDAIHVALPNALHAEWTGRALRSGKHVLCESRSPSRLRRSHSASTRRRRPGGCARKVFMWRTHPQTLLARQLLADGAIGRLTTVRAALRTTAAPATSAAPPTWPAALWPTWVATASARSACSPAIRLFAGDPTRAWAEAVFAGVDVRLAAVLRGPNDTIATYDCGLDQPRADELELIGTEGVIRLPDPWLCRPPQ